MNTNSVLPARSPAIAWLKLVRVHFIPLSLTSGLAGYVLAEHGPTLASALLGLAVCTSGYGIGVIVNDFADRRADAINAPDRPLVSGEINPNLALAAVAVSVVAVAGAAAVLAPSVAIWGVVALAGHIVYQATKGTPMVGNVVNGIDLALFTLVGAAAGAPGRAWYDVAPHALIAAGVFAIMLSGFCLVGYFKDVPGDSVAGYRTLPVALGPRRASWFALPWPFAATAAAIVAATTTLGGSAAFWVFVVASTVAAVVSMRHLIGDPERRYYEALLWYIRATVLLMLALGATVRPWLFVGVALPMLVFLELTLRTTRGTGRA